MVGCENTWLSALDTHNIRTHENFTVDMPQGLDNLLTLLGLHGAAVAGWAEDLGSELAICPLLLVIYATAFAYIANLGVYDLLKTTVPL